MADTYLVTGAGSGIGRAIARKLAGHGARILLVGRNMAKLEATRSALEEPESHAVLPTDVRNTAGLEEALERAEIGPGGLRGIVTAAGVGGANQFGPEDRWDEILEINLGGTYRSVMVGLPYLRKAEGYRHIVMVSSVLARLGVPGYSAYCAAKAGVLGLMRSLAVELAPEKILVNALAPGWVDTAMADEGLEGIAAATGASVEETRAEQMAQVPLGKMSTVEEIAELVDFLCSGRQTSFTGQVLDMNNGALMPA